LDAVGNYFIAGPNSNQHFTGEYKATDHVYQKDNWADMDKDGKLNGRAVTPADFGSGADAPTMVSNPSVAAEFHVTVQPAAEAFASVIAGAGCSRQRDAVDARLIAAVNSFGAQGRIIRNEAEAGGPGDWKEVHAPADMKLLEAGSF
jgi:hypothetical protein